MIMQFHASYAGDHPRSRRRRRRLRLRRRRADPAACRTSRRRDRGAVRPRSRGRTPGRRVPAPCAAGPAARRWCAGAGLGGRRVPGAAAWRVGGAGRTACGRRHHGGRHRLRPPPRRSRGLPGVVRLRPSGTGRPGRCGLRAHRVRPRSAPWGEADRQPGLLPDGGAAGAIAVRARRRPDRRGGGRRKVRRQRRGTQRRCRLPVHRARGRHEGLRHPSPSAHA